ncbi:HAD hydrolase-like protein [Dyella caseinilytica]|uniref:HAD hydrolase-like protein n=1 Tax=Dyella caseinilytica TaxID=1849581 RepID=A0ABX7GS63_9GAMM|nr:HAD hydrolase-like protein [Dyella caseinilytica]QRN53129.1 HAD hydrolase-like protein [Dyella caseinilytica]GGA11738.1 haloacid dehalogenase [Dyella caseinilytica]
MLCLFDLDGTLIDSELGVTACIRHALTRLDVSTPADLREWIGPPLRQSFAPLLDHDETRIEAAVHYYHERFTELGWREYAIYPGIADMIASLQTAGHQLAIVTSKPHRHAQPIVDELPFGNHFEKLYGPHPSSSHSEKASMIAAALADFGASPKQTIMIGDRRYDMEGAVANGVAGVGVLWGFGSREELEEAGAHAVIEHPERLGALLAV